MNLEKYTFLNLINTALSKVPDTVDKSEGSIIYDALAPACYTLAQYYLDLNEVLKVQFIETSYGEYLDKLTSQFGVYRLEATKAVKRAKFYDEQNNLFDINIGDRFSTMGANENLIYEATKKISTGIYELTCEELGTKGNSYTGNLLPITFINGLATAVMESNIVIARDTEDDDSLKARYISLMSDKPFGGNIEDYLEKVLSISGVGAVQIYPVWNGGGTVKLSIVDNEHNPINETVINNIKEQIDPEEYTGQGYGLAPIGHQVTVVTPDEKVLNINASINTEIGTDIEQVQSEVEESIKEYIEKIRENFGTKVNNSYVQKIYVAQILAAILNVDGIVNATTVTINGSSDDITLIENGTKQEIAKLGTVTLNEAS